VRTFEAAVAELALTSADCSGVNVLNILRP
jgi:hypothetical protein